MTKREHAAQLRADTSIHYNCCQAVLVPFAAECGLDEESALRLGQHFGSGMRMGAICGTVTGGLMVLGLAGAGEEKAKQFRGPWGPELRLAAPAGQGAGHGAQVPLRRHGV